MSFAGWAELLFIAVLAFIIIGPKDLPKVLYTLGRLLGHIRRLSNEFMAEFEAIHVLREGEENHKKKKRNSV